MYLLTRILLVAALGLFFLTPASAQEANVPSAEAQQLIDLLENPEARDALIQSLRGAAETTTANEVVDPQEDTSIGRQLADFTKSFFETAATSVGSALGAVIALPTTLMALDGGQLDVLWEALQALAVVIVVTVGAYLVLRAGARLIYRRMGDKAHDWGFVRTLAVVIATCLIDILVVLAAWGLGYLVALYLYGETGVIGVRQTLYLNAFLLVGLAKVAIRAVLAPSTHELRFVAISDLAARRMSSWFGAIASVIGYGQLLIVPIVNRQASYAAGRGISTLLAFIAIAMAAILVVRSRKDVAGWILGPAPEERPSALRFIGRNWYIPVLLYLAGLAVIVAARPDGLILPLLISSAQVVGIIILGVLISGGLSRFAVRGMHMPMNVSSRMPTLEPRINSLLGRVIQVVRVFIVIGVLAFALDAIGLWDISGLMRSEFGVWAAGAIISIAFILLAGAILWLALVSWVDYRLNPEFGTAPTSREITLLTLLRNAATIALMVIIVMFVLAELGVDIAPLIASAGVLGLAIGFGAQKMVQDIITGIFIQFENAINVGDVVTLGGTTGTVEKLTIRSVTLRDVHAVVHLIPFSSVDMVSNYVRDYSYFVADVGIAYRENVNDGKDAMVDAFEELRASEAGENITGDLEWFGVQSLGDSAVVLRARIKTVPGTQWGTGRAFNEICKRIMDERGIEIPFPHQTIYFGEDKNGAATHLRLDRAADDAKTIEGSSQAPAQDTKKTQDPHLDMEDDADL
ncbi:mechanosensitive ion channel domain-containing protein [Roseovarius atlanticus]|uniref:mechanosensitive ion channel domain-containing protein n=1 Tax=Roseovarius atlanticus TaxID=1641875 RepID=UPI001C93DF34|nr:mechanosensitive ion channel domain-containing protein [Roseovarius atlanticus]MBY5986663.1 mechanosensitive ion channel [Roseovarius atlanticus]MBY6125303.1 mechanosensitive ion channel [Roseovarius atlanticus]MBY6150236.1 mechanosensitive ion channel [Roseovarius atlanticus]